MAGQPVAQDAEGRGGDHQVHRGGAQEERAEVRAGFERDQDHRGGAGGWVHEPTRGTQVVETPARGGGRCGGGHRRRAGQARRRLQGDTARGGGAARCGRRESLWRGAQARESGAVVAAARALGVFRGARRDEPTRRRRARRGGCARGVRGEEEPDEPAVQAEAHAGGGGGAEDASGREPKTQSRRLHPAKLSRRAR